MNDNPTWAEAVAQREHRFALGLTDVYLSKDTVDSLDWSKCISVDPGGSHRLDIATSVKFTFEDKGITGHWHFDIEPREANGSGHYHIDVAGIQRILSLLPPFPRRRFVDYLTSCAIAVEKKADEYQQIATKEYGIAGMLRSAKG